ncbi:MAG: NAD(P)-dependent oxidoreductase [Candidatus Acidiferrales bacterium]
MKPTIGFIGLGLMGKPMAQNLIRAGFSVVVWNRTKARAQELVSEGAKLGENPRETAKVADVVITIVSDPPALEDVLWGTNGAMEGLRRGSVYIDSSTISPDLARRAAAACTERGVDFLDAPVTGGDWGAKKGELVFMIGGKAEVLERVRPVLEVLGKKFFLLGPNGAGQTVKLAMNLILALEIEALAEALVLVGASGVAGEKLIEVLQSSMARAGVMDVKAPNMLKNEYPPSFPLRLMHKDMRLALELSRQKGVELPAAAASFEVYSAVKDASKDDADYSAVARFWSQGSKAKAGA